MESWLTRSSNAAENTERQVPNKMKPGPAKVRQYSEEYVLMGFTSTNCNPPKALCFFCGERLANSCMKPAHLQRHIKTKHARHAGQPPEFYKRKLSEFRSCQDTMRKASMTSAKALEASCAMGEVSADAVTLDLLREARETVRGSPLGVINTPMIPWCQTTLTLDIHCNIHIKLENMQRTGSFKIRGVANQFARRPRGGNFVTMSAGNYGKSFAYASKHYGSKGKVVMPEAAPVSRSILIQGFGVEVERVPTSCLMNVVNRCVQEDGMTFLHSYDDLDLIAGHASLGMEVLEVMPEPDVVVVCCGGGGLLAGVAAAIKLSGCDKTRIYGVEPDGACTMHRSFIEKKPVDMDTKSIASGLAPPFAGTLPFELCQRYVEGIVLINDEEITAAVSTLYRSGLVVEPSGCAAFAAIVNGKIPELEGKNVVCILSGGNIGKDELVNFPG